MRKSAFIFKWLRGYRLRIGMATATYWDGYGYVLGWVDGYGFINYLVAVTMTEPRQSLRTIDVEIDDVSIVKPGELIDIVEMTPLTLHDRRIYNLLILNAWESISEAKEHRIHKRDLRGSHNVNERVSESLMRLMAAVAQVQVERDDGETYTRRVQLLGMTEESAKGDGLLYYSFPAAVRAIIRESTQWARLEKEIMFSFASKYALALYEMVQKRINLKYKTSEEFTLERFRGLLGVEPGKHREFKNLNLRAIQPAVLEVNGLASYGCMVEPIYTGRKVTSVRLSWWAKNIDEKKAAFREVKFSRVGRRARLAAKAETAVAPLALLPSSAVPAGLPAVIPRGLTQPDYDRIKRNFPDLDIGHFEREFLAWIAGREPPRDYAAAFYGFVKRKIGTISG
jgi:hypothetical protein